MLNVSFPTSHSDHVLKMATRLPSSVLGLRPRGSVLQRLAVVTQHLKRTNTAIAARTMSSSAPLSEEEVLFSDEGDHEKGGVFRLITLNRPKALNALNHNMIQLIKRDMMVTAEDDRVPVVVMVGAGNKAFCAGGDIRAVTDAGKVGAPLAQQFFLAEYSLNHYIGTYKKPFIAIIDGITMGGGVGLSVHSPFRVATENTLFAMPETFIGLFPDVGGSYFLPRLRKNLGLYLALTGHRLKGRDVHHAGVATHLVAREKLPELRQALAELCSGNISARDFESNCAAVRAILDNFHDKCLDVDPRGFSLSEDLDNIDSCFDKDSVEGIVSALEANGSDWAKKQLEIFQKVSPTSLKVTLHQLQLGAKLSFAECFKMEYRMSQAAMTGNDFYEGVRAVIVEKDNTPKWNPATLSEVTPDVVQRYFAPLADDKELKL